MFIFKLRICNQFKIQMTLAAKFIILGIVLVSVTSYRHDGDFVTFNTSARETWFSTSIATNLDTPFTLYSPLLIDNQGSTVTFIPDAVQQKFRFDPVLPEDESRLYNEYNNEEFWYAFKKSVEPEITDTAATFAYAKVTVGNQSGNYVLPLFSLPLSFLNMDSLYRCDDVLISYINTGSILDVAIFSQNEQWHLFPETLWGFRHKDEQINFSRQTFSVGTSIQVDVGPNKYCVLNDELPKNTYNLVEQSVYTLEDLFVKYSTSLELRNKQTEQEL